MGLDLRNVDGLEAVAIPLGYPGNKNADGLQEAHIIGQDFWTRALTNFRALIDPQNTMSVDDRRNGFHAPESKAGSMALGVARHSGAQQRAYDALAYVEVDKDNSKQFLNVLENETETAITDLQSKLADPATPAAERAAIPQQIADIQREARIKEAAFADFRSVHSLDQKILNKVGAKYEITMYSVPFNEADAQAGTSAFEGKTAAERLADPKIKAQFTDQALANNPLFNEILAMRKSGGDPLRDLSRELIAEIPEVALMRYKGCTTACDPVLSEQIQDINRHVRYLWR